MEFGVFFQRQQPGSAKISANIINKSFHFVSLCHKSTVHFNWIWCMPIHKNKVPTMQQRTLLLLQSRGESLGGCVSESHCTVVTMSFGHRSHDEYPNLVYVFCCERAKLCINRSEILVFKIYSVFSNSCPASTDIILFFIAFSRYCRFSSVMFG